MKKHLLLIFILAAFVYSCKKSSNSPVTILGDWYVKTDSTAANNSPLTVSYYNLEDNYKFNADGTGRRNLNGGYNFTWKMVSGTVYFQYSAYTNADTTVAARKDTCDVVTLTANKLVLVSEYKTGSSLVTEYQICSR